jgi:regulatory protein
MTARDPVKPAVAVEAAAVRLLAARDHSREELRRKLAARFGEGADIDAVLDGLQARGWQDERRFVEQFIEQRCRRGQGPLRIRAELRRRGVDDGLVDATIRDSETDWASRLHAVARARFGDAPAADDRERARRARFLEQRGFPSGLVRSYLFD